MTVKEYNNDVVVEAQDDSQISLYKYLHQMEETLLQLLATKDTVKSQTAKRKKIR